MRHTSLPLLLLLALVAGAADVRAQAAPQVGSCSLGTAEASLDVNNVFGAVFNTGSLFFGNTLTNGDGYLVPKATGRSPIFASGIWVGGKVGGQLRVAGARYTNFNFWPGPLDAATGRPVNPASCRAYDRIYSVKRDDIRAYEAGGQFSQDLTDWPYQLGAPVVDGDNNPNNYNLAGGDRPDIIGDQGIWWVMNDVGGAHAGTNTPPLGIEVQVLAFAFARADALGSTTFYKYKIINKSGSAIQDTYISVFSDPDLGNAADDYVGSDTQAGLGYVYNADNDDEGSTGYGLNPPAVGYDFFQGPIVPDRNGDGIADTLGTTAFSYFINGSSNPATTDPSTGILIYNFQQGLWGDGSEMRAFGTGFQQTQGEVTKFAFPGDPVAGQTWSEPNNGTATPNTKGDRRLVVHTGPFTLENGSAQDIVFGVVYARGTSNLNSITALRAADRLAQRAYDIDFALPSPPPAPALCTEATQGTGTCLSASAENGKITLTYGYAPSSENFLGRYEVVNGFIVGTPGVTDFTYNFEGFNIYQYPNANFETEQRRLVATYDVVNGVTEVRDQVFDPTIGDNNVAITARGTDSGLQYSFTADGLTNFTDYYYGITAYAYNADSSPKVIESQATNITVRPSGLTSGVRTQSAPGDSVSTVINVQNGGGVVSASVVDPSAVTGASYNVVFFSAPDGSVNYNIVNTTTGVTVLDGAAYYAATGHSLPQAENVIVIDGVSFSVTGPAPEVLGVDERDATGAVIDADLIGSLNAASTRPPVYVVGAQGAAANDPAAVLGRLNFNNYLTDNVPREYEIRWVAPAQGQVILRRNWDQTTPGQAYLSCLETGTVVSNTAGPSNLVTTPAPIVGGYPRMPFQIWEIEVDGTERQVHANVIDDDSDLCYSFTTAANSGALPLAGFGYERIYASRVPYIESELSNPVDVYTRTNIADAAHQAFGRLTILLRTGSGNLAIPPQPGTRIHIRTSKPNAVGDSFTINTAGLQRSTPELADEQAALDMIAAVPNPYFGQSGYETGNLSRVVRFTNLPAQATTIRIYTVSGSLIQTLRKDGGSRSLDWNLQTVNNLPVASGMYLVHVDVEGVGERTLKLGIINRRSQVNVF